jgi:putative transposase
VILENYEKTRGCKQPPYFVAWLRATTLRKDRAMSWYRRWYREGGLYFFSPVTFARRPVFVTELARQQLRAAFRKTQEERPFQIVAIVLLPDHLHCLWQLPPGDADFSTRWRLVKSRFTIGMLAAGFQERGRSQRRRDRHEHAIWQRRCWEHLIEEEEDWKRHLDYIHYNPVKHGHVAAPRDWSFSTFHRYVDQGEYDIDWGGTEPVTLRNWSPPELGGEP